MTRFVFAGKRPSARALATGATWQNGRLAACTLHAVLRDLGLDPAAQRYLNLFPGDPAQGEPGP